MSFDWVQSDAYREKLKSEYKQKTRYKRIENLAFEWAVDYKPWEDDLSPQKYAEYGFIQGYLRALRDLE
jgi:hypothetical protein